MMKKLLLSILILSAVLSTAEAQVRSEVFGLLDLNRKELREVKTAVDKGDFDTAAARLLDYYRSRTDVKNPDMDISKVKASKTDRQRADDGLVHKFYVHDGYQPSFFYGDDIDWQYWPVKDNELRWQLHRTKWWVPMGKVYYTTKDERYAAEWVLQYRDWIKKNPLTEQSFDEDKLISSGEADTAAENMRFAWRPLEVSDRLEKQPQQFALFLDSKNFTPEFLTEFLANYYRHVKFLTANFSKKGNHLLFEAQRVLYAGTFFPEFKEAKEWRRTGVDILNREMNVQVYGDGMQFELDPHYHLAAINIFLKGLKMADLNGFRNDFPQSYIDKTEKMIKVYYNLCFPDYTNPAFSDAKIHDKAAAIADYRKWTPTFPANKMIRYLATEGAKGELEGYYSIAFKDSGFYVMRNGWGADATQMDIKAGPPAFWHNQPDNGTFEMWRRGRNFFPDSGSYVYAGDAEVNAERAWFRQSRVHNTLTLDNADFETTDTKLLFWKADYEGDILAVRNPSYKDWEHTRVVFFPERKFFVIVDRATGTSAGEAELHYNICEGKTVEKPEELTVGTDFADDNNIIIKVFGPSDCAMKRVEGWYSQEYRSKRERPAYEFTASKESGKEVAFITVILPVESASAKHAIKARFAGRQKSNSVSVKVTVDGTDYDLKCRF